jgi:hypothetical protein
MAIWERGEQDSRSDEDLVSAMGSIEIPKYDSDAR